MKRYAVTANRAVQKYTRNAGRPASDCRIMIRPEAESFHLSRRQHVRFDVNKVYALLA